MGKGYQGIFFLFLSGIGCTHSDASKSKPAADAPVLVDVMIARPKKINNTIEATGTVVANEFVELHPEVNGRLTYLNVPEGKNIAAGTVIARIYNDDIRAQIAKSKVQLDLSQKTMDRYKQLLDVNGLNQSDYDAVVNQVNGYKADIEYNEALLNKTIVRAPFSGVVGLRQVSVGAYISSTDVIASIQQLDKIKIDFTIPEEYTGIIRIGSTVQVLLDAATQSHVKASIIATEPQVNQSSRNLKVRALLQEGKPNPGTFVKVYVNAGSNARAIMIPTNAIIPNDKDNQVVLVKNGKAVFSTVLTGVREANNVEITRGISEGDTVVVTGLLFARAKAPLTIRSFKIPDSLTSTQ
jgi:membrane fusion protein, multidrug efflux system